MDMPGAESHPTGKAAGIFPASRSCISRTPDRTHKDPKRTNRMGLRMLSGGKASLTCGAYVMYAALSALQKNQTRKRKGSQWEREGESVRSPEGQPVKEKSGPWVGAGRLQVESHGLLRRMDRAAGGRGGGVVRQVLDQGAHVRVGAGQAATAWGGEPLPTRRRTKTAFLRYSLGCGRSANAGPSSGVSVDRPASRSSQKQY